MTSDVLIKLIIAMLFTSAIPGLCTTLAMSLGMTVGVKRTFWMIGGELLGVAIVVSLVVFGAVEYIHRNKEIFDIFTMLGALYLCYVAFQMWQMSHSELELNDINVSHFNGAKLFTQGLSTALLNPKLWIFLASLLPPFVSDDQPLAPQLSLILTIVLITEFTMLLIYASGGSHLKKVLTKKAYRLGLPLIQFYHFSTESLDNG